MPDVPTSTDRRLAMLVYVAGLAIILLDSLTAPMKLSFEGVSVVGAQRILAGAVPYRDFWTIYAPGSFYLLAACFGMFGTEIIFGRFLGAALMALVPMLVYLVARFWTGRTAALFVAGLSVFRLASAALGVSTYTTVLPALLAAIWSASVYFRTTSRQFLMAAGLFASLAMMCKHDVGGYFAIAMGLTLLLRRLQRPDGMQAQDQDHSAAARPGILRELGAFALGCVAIAGPVYAALLLVAGRDMIRDLIVFPLTDFPLSRPESYPGPFPSMSEMTSPALAVREISFRLNHLLPTVVAIGSAAWLIWQRRRMRADRFASQLLLTCLFPFFWKAAHIQINTHIYTMSILCLLVGAMWTQDLIALRPRLARRIALAALAGIAVAAWLPNSAYGIYRGLFPVDSLSEVDLPHARGLRADSGMRQTLAQAIHFVRDRTSTSDPVYVGTDRHDLVIISNPLIYTLLDRPAPVRYHELHPAIADTCRVQNEMVAGLRSKNVPYCILSRIFESSEIDRFLPNYQKRLPRIGCSVLDDYIRGHFVLVQRFGRYTVWQRKDGADAVRSIGARHTHRGARSIDPLKQPA